MSPNLRELLGTRVLIGDGAVGTLLGERGVGFGHPYARANLSHPEMVTDIHEDYLRAGADVIETNTFAANRFKLETHDLEERVREVNAEGARLARKAARSVAGTGDRALVLGAIGPLGRPLAPVGPVGPKEARSVFLEQAEALLEGGADAILLETFTDLSSCGSPTRRSKPWARRYWRTRPSSRTARRSPKGCLVGRRVRSLPGAPT